MHPHADIVLDWLSAHPHSVAYQRHDAGVLLLDVFSGKQRELRWSEVERIERGTDRLSGHPYVVLLLEGGSQLVLAEQGLAFPPDLRNTGPLPIPTSVFCFRDYEHLVGLVRGASLDRVAEAAQIILVLVALVDGARAVGLETDREERELDGLLGRLEQHQRP